MFHKRGPAAAKHRSLKLLLYRRMTHVGVSVDRSQRMPTSEVSVSVMHRSGVRPSVCPSHLFSNLNTARDAYTNCRNLPLTKARATTTTTETVT